MFAKVFGFEVRYHLKSRLFIFSAAIFFIMTYLGVVSPNVQFGSAGGANLNSPFVIAQVHVVMALLGVLVGTAFLNSAALRDHEFRMAEIVYSTRITKFSYLLARFFGAFLVIYLAYLATTIGFALAATMPWLDQELIGPFVFSHYAYAALVIGLPALFANLAIVYTVAVFTRDQRIAYAAIIGLLVLYQVAAAVLGQLEYRSLAALVDPSGAGALSDVMRYWTVFERNTNLVPIAGALLYNRLIWFSISVAALALTLWRFQFEVSKRTNRQQKTEADGAEDLLAAPRTYSRQRATFANGVAWHQFLARSRFEVRGVLKSVFFWVLVALAAALSLGSFFSLSSIFGTAIYPVTRAMTNIMGGSVTLSLLIIIVFYGAELVWRDREVRFQDILGSSPAPSWVFVISKMVAAVLVVGVFLGVTALVAILFQLFKGFYDFEFNLYLIAHLYNYGMLFYLAVVLSIVLQVMAPNKYFGMLFMVVYIIALITLPNAGWEDPLYLYGGTSGGPYSDMNGYDGQLVYAAWYNLYWSCFAVLIGILGYLVWSRGPEEKFRTRLRNIGTNFTRQTGVIVAIAAIGFIGCFAWIYYNTHVVNEYITSDDRRKITVEYERRYIDLKGKPIPRIIDINIDVDLYPESQGFEARGTYVVENKTDTALTDVPVGFGWQTEVEEVELEGATLVASDDDYKFYQFVFDPAIEPGESRLLSFTTSRNPQGFRHNNNVPPLQHGGGVLGNGTFVDNNALGPYLGFNEGLLLTDRAQRRREDMDPIPRYPDLDDESERGNSYLTQDSDWVMYEATVTTSADQIAVTSGYLIEDKTVGDRRTFHYKMDAPMQNLFVIQSARYESKREDWNGIELSVYYYPEHDRNIDRMLTSLKRSLEYFGENFSPYQYRQMRILEFPAYANFAMSLPNTIAWSEGLGFIADVRDPEDIDYVFYVGAHEVAHQWWGHQVSSAKVQGQTTLVETLAQYSALMVMEHEYGPHLMRKFLKYELDIYLQGRGGEAIEELPLYRVENQPYIHYRKGSVVMYALKDYMGEAAVNRALVNLIEETAYRYNPYPTSRDLLRNLRAQATNDAQQSLITDLFEKITLWDLKIEEATAAAREDGKYDVTITVAATKFEADGYGRQTEVPLDMPIDIGIFTKHPDKVTEGDEHVLYFEKHQIRSGERSLTFVVDQLPSHVGIDPYNKLIDRNSDDNLDTVDERSAKLGTDTRTASVRLGTGVR